MPKIKEFLGVDSKVTRIMGVEMAPLAPVREMAALVQAKLEDHAGRLEALEEEVINTPGLAAENKYLRGRLRRCQETAFSLTRRIHDLEEELSAIRVGEDLSRDYDGLDSDE